MKSRIFKEVDALICQTEERWSDKHYVASLRVKSLLIELFNLLLINSIKLVPYCSYDEPYDIVGKNGPKILALWHGSFFGSLYFWRAKNVAVMASLSKDGDLITKILDSLGFQTIRGSSSRGGARVLLEAVNKLKKGTTVAVTIDGPKGPFHEVKPGIIKLAQKTGIPIVPSCMVCSNAVSLPSWDRLQIPLPFSKTLQYLGEPLKIAPNMSIEEGCKVLKSYMLECEKKAEEILKAGC